MSAVVGGDTIAPVLLTVSEVAGVLRTSAKAIYSMIERDQLPGVTRVGRRVLVRRDVLVNWLGQKCTPSPAR
jgi:excisionase family DNA binding protein